MPNDNYIITPATIQEPPTRFLQKLKFLGPGFILSASIVGSGELISALDFFARYHKSPGPFSSMSFCSVPRSTFTRLTEPPFQANGAEDYYFFTRINLFGPIAFSSAQTVAYRFHAGSLSSNKLRVVGIAVQAYELLEREYKDFPDQRFYKAFQNAVASKRRHYAKLLFGAGAVASGRDQLRRSLGDSSAPISSTPSTVRTP